MAIQEEDLILCMLAVIKQYGENWNLEIKNIGEIYDMLETDTHVRLGFNPLPDGDGVIVTGIIGTKAIQEYERIERMINTSKVGKA